VRGCGRGCHDISTARPGAGACGGVLRQDGVPNKLRSECEVRGRICAIPRGQSVKSVMSHRHLVRSTHRVAVPRSCVTVPAALVSVLVSIVVPPSVVYSSLYTVVDCVLFVASLTVTMTVPMMVGVIH